MSQIQNKIMFCPSCGTAPVQRSGNGEGGWKCSICKGEFTITVVKQAQLTLEEAEAAFNAIPLTDKKAVRAQKRRLIQFKK